MLRAVCAALMLAPFACVRSRPPEPAPALRALASSLAGDDPHAAWARLSREARARVPEPQFVAAWRDTRAERTKLADSLRHASLPPLAAEVEAGDAYVPLVFEDGHWRLSEPRPLHRGAPTPEAALAHFTAALEAHDFDGFLRTLGEPLRSLIEHELAERVAGLNAAAKKPISIEGDRAIIHYDSKHRLELRREHDQWQVIDFN